MMSAERIFELVGHALEIDPRMITVRGRDQRIVLARQICGHILSRSLGLSSVDVGNVLGGQNHSTVLHARKRLEERMAQDTVLRSLVETLLAQAELMRRFHDITSGDALDLAQKAGRSRRCAIALNVNQVMAISYLASELWEIARTAEVLSWQLTNTHDEASIIAMSKSIRDEMAALRGKSKEENEYA